MLLRGEIPLLLAEFSGPFERMGGAGGGGAFGVLDFCGGARGGSSLSISFGVGGARIFEGNAPSEVSSEEVLLGSTRCVG